MYAIIALGGRQWKVEPGTRLEVNRVALPAGGELPVEQILAAHDGTALHVGHPYVKGASVICEVLEHRRGPKVISYHFRRRENWRKTVGHRQPHSRLVVKDIRLPGAPQAVKAEAAGAAQTTVRPAKAAVPKAAAKTAVNPTLKGGVKRRPGVAREPKTRPAAKPTTRGA
ncbi:MAG: 50S ribosomal protein L21 [Candidatus Omnitrophica bacterium]|nr:50S ribosomal protein L21 [Candidatus Omnitrophota bacterium]